MHISALSAMGHSAGAYLALMSGFVVTPRPAAVVSIAGYGRLSAEEFSKPSQHYVSSYALAEEESARRFLQHGRGLIVSESGPFDSMQRYTGRGLFYLFLRQSGTWLREISGGKSVDLEWLREDEPLFNISSAYPPTTLIHGGRDADVSFEQSLRLQRALASHGVPNELLSEEHWGHAFVYDFDKSAEEAFDRTVLFLQKYT